MLLASINLYSHLLSHSHSLEGAHRSEEEVYALWRFLTCGIHHRGNHRKREHLWRCISKH